MLGMRPADGNYILEKETNPKLIELFEYHGKKTNGSRRTNVSHSQASEWLAWPNSTSEWWRGRSTT